MEWKYDFLNSAVVCIISWEIVALNRKEKNNCVEFEVFETLYQHTFYKCILKNYLYHVTAWFKTKLALIIAKCQLRYLFEN